VDYLDRSPFLLTLFGVLCDRKAESLPSRSSPRGSGWVGLAETSRGGTRDEVSKGSRGSRLSGHVGRHRRSRTAGRPDRYGGGDVV